MPKINCCESCGRPLPKKSLQTTDQPQPEKKVKTPPTYDELLAKQRLACDRAKAYYANHKEAIRTAYRVKRAKAIKPSSQPQSHQIEQGDSLPALGDS